MEPWTLTMNLVRLKNGALTGLSILVVTDSHHFYEKQDPDLHSHLSEKWVPNPQEMRIRNPAKTVADSPLRILELSSLSNSYTVGLFVRYLIT